MKIDAKTLFEMKRGEIREFVQKHTHEYDNLLDGEYDIFLPEFFQRENIEGNAIGFVQYETVIDIGRYKPEDLTLQNVIAFKTEYESANISPFAMKVTERKEYKSLRIEFTRPDGKIVAIIAIHAERR